MNLFDLQFYNVHHLGLQLIERAMKKLDAAPDPTNSLQIPADVVRVRDAKRELLERLVVRLLSGDALREQFHFTPYSTISYLALGTKPIGRALLNGSHPQPLPFELRVVKPPPVTVGGKQSSASAPSGESDGEWLSTASKPAPSSTASANGSGSRASAGDSKLKLKPAQLTVVGAQQSVFARSRNELSVKHSAAAAAATSARNGVNGAAQSRANSSLQSNPSASKAAPPHSSSFTASTRAAHINSTSASANASASSATVSHTGSTAPSASKRLKLVLEEEESPSAVAQEDDPYEYEVSDELLLSAIEEPDAHSAAANSSSLNTHYDSNEFNFD